jgi:hypothetical protein
VKKVSLIIGAIFIVTAVVWYFWLSSYWTQRIPPGWSWTANYIGTNAYADASGNFPEQDSINVYDRTVMVVEDQRPNSVILEDTYLTSDANTGQVTWEFKFSAPVDPKTGQHLSESYRGDYFVFPRNVEKTTYRLRFSSYPGIPLTFQKEETVEGFATYLFTYQGSVDYAFSYAGSANYPGVKVEPGQEIKCWDNQMIVRMWVEPVTGETLKSAESCYSGDYVYDLATGKAIYPISRWGGETAGDDVINRANAISAERTRILWLGQYAPGLLFVAGLVSLAIGMVGLFSQQRKISSVITAPSKP